jgi:CO/xanthine dehydrogenase Mo-binding subunit
VATVETAAAGFIRQDGKEKVTGTGRYTADLIFTGMAHAKFRYADHPHAKIVSIDTAKARALPGVVAVVTQDDLPDVRFGSFVQDRTLFAKDKVRFEGEIVAGVAALTPEIAAEAARLIEIDYEVLPAIADFERAMEEGAPIVHEGLAGYDKDENIVASGNTMAFHTIVKGDADAAMAGADVVVKGRYVSDASQGVPIEPRAVVAQWQGDKVTVWSSTQVPYVARAGVAQTLQIPEADVRIVVPLLGGGFGAKCDLHFEGQVAALARAAKRPVKLVFSRMEEFVAIAQRREGIVMEFETGVTRDGHLVARRARLVLDKGAYCGEGGFLGQMAAMHACGPYEIDAIKVESYLNYTNNQPSGSVRAPTAPQVCWGLEQHMDEIARAISLDPVELRRRTLITEGSEGPTRQIFDKVGVRDTLETALEMIGYDDADLPEDEAIGVATGWWPCMAAPAGAYVQMNGDGSATIVTGAQENGSGAVMAMPMFVGQELGIDPNDVSVVYQDTDVAPWDMGSCGSQTTFNSGRAILAAAAEVREQLLDAAAEQLEADRGDIELVDGTARVKGSPDLSVAIADLVGEIGTVHGKGSGDVPEATPGDTGGCVGRLGNETFLAPQLITQAAHVKVDRATGVVRVLKVAAAHDSGRILNKRGADGQVYGGVVMGVGLALSEGTMLDEEGRQRNPHLLDYKLVTASDAPEIDVRWVEYDSVGPRGSKGVGEPPQVPTAGAIANAITKVLGTQVRRLPMTPERVWAAQREARG